jgi:hypothetical protein
LIVNLSLKRKVYQRNQKKMLRNKLLRKLNNKLLTQINTDEKINAVKNSSSSPAKEKISVNQCKSVSQIEG